MSKTPSIVNGELQITGNDYVNIPETRGEYNQENAVLIENVQELVGYGSGRVSWRAKSNAISETKLLYQYNGEYSLQTEHILTNDWQTFGPYEFPSLESSLRFVFGFDGEDTDVMSLDDILIEGVAKPIIALNGDAKVQIEKDTVYQDLGATAKSGSGPTSTDLTSSIQVSGDIK